MRSNKNKKARKLVNDWVLEDMTDEELAQWLLDDEDTCDTLRNENETLKVLWKAALESCYWYERERDEALATCTELYAHNQALIRDMLTQRDEARAECTDLWERFESAQWLKYFYNHNAMKEREGRIEAQEERDKLRWVCTERAEELDEARAVCTELMLERDIWHREMRRYRGMCDELDNDDPGVCVDCGAQLQTVRPGKTQCPDCGVCERCGYRSYRGSCTNRCWESTNYRQEP